MESLIKALSSRPILVFLSLVAILLWDLAIRHLECGTGILPPLTEQQEPQQLPPEQRPYIPGHKKESRPWIPRYGPTQMGIRG